MQSNNFVFKGFNSLRFFASMLVVLHHGETVKKKQSLPHFENFPLLKNGATAVEFFFVLSGFLITFLLLKEYEAKRNINVGNFYMRRVLRIWPLYFILVVLGLIVVPVFFQIINLNNPHVLPFFEAFLLYVLFLPNLVNILYGGGLLQPLWSIGIEEQFYLLWAPAVKFFRKYLPAILVSVIIFRLTFYTWYFFEPEKNIFMRVLQTMQFECMATGGIAAYWVWKGQNLKKIHGWEWLFGGLILTKILLHEYISESIFGAFYEATLFHPVFRTTLWSAIFAGFIVCVGTKENSLFRMENKLMEKVGEWSYGIYMYHLIVINVVLLFLKKLSVNFSDFVFHMLYFSFVLSGIVLLAGFSFEFLERKILKLKTKFI
jgi:peptidoglycan/LPS O-acetylase OafA/YrhL